MTSLPVKRGKAHRTFIADLNRQFPSMDLTSHAQTDNPITLNYNTNTKNLKESVNSEGKSIYEEEGIEEKITSLKNNSNQPLKFWPDSVKSFEHEPINKYYATSITQHNLITECIKNKDKWGTKSISREIDDTAFSLLDRRNETESKKSSIYHSEKIQEENEQEEEKAEEHKTEEKKSASKTSFVTKTNRTNNSAKKENATNNEDQSFVSDNEKVITNIYCF